MATGSLSRENAPHEDCLTLLEQSHHDLLQIVACLSDEELRTQPHPDLSPLGWHLGHTGFIERFWIDTQVLAKTTTTAGLEDYYLPERNEKSTRSRLLPERSVLVDFVNECFAYSSAVLPDLLQQADKYPLLRNAYLVYFLAQHNYQHRETMLQVLQQLQLHRQILSSVSSTLVSRPPFPPELVMDIARFELGAQPGPLAYDNELARHPATLAPFRIAATAVSNAEYLGFIESGGYQQRQHWSDRGWQWQQEHQVRSPLHWRQHPSGGWFALEPGGAMELKPEAAVNGINYFEAEAFARFAGCRLPHEAEWEYAAVQNNIVHGDAWEWCANTFYPYPGYQPFPYDNYSRAWFDGNHFSLRGGSRHTHALIKRPTFRNFYTPEKRHIFAGLRLAKNL